MEEKTLMEEFEKTLFNELEKLSEKWIQKYEESQEKNIEKFLAGMREILLEADRESMGLSYYLGNFTESPADALFFKKFGEMPQFHSLKAYLCKRVRGKNFFPLFKEIAEKHGFNENLIYYRSSLTTPFNFYAVNSEKKEVLRFYSYYHDKNSFRIRAEIASATPPASEIEPPPVIRNLLYLFKNVKEEHPFL